MPMVLQDPAGRRGGEAEEGVVRKHVAGRDAGRDTGRDAGRDVGGTVEFEEGREPEIDLARMNEREKAEVRRIRQEIEVVDGALVDLVERRRSFAVDLGKLKDAAGLPVADLAREAEVVRLVAARARAAGLEEEVVRHIFWCLIDLSRRAQTGETR